jgi:hypothetical protein
MIKLELSEADARLVRFTLWTHMSFCYERANSIGQGETRPNGSPYPEGAAGRILDEAKRCEAVMKTLRLALENL